MRELEAYGLKLFCFCDDLFLDPGGMTFDGFDGPDGMSCQVDNGQGQCVYP
jgi:hypothetical protein